MITALKKKESRNIPLSGNFSVTALTDPFSKEEIKRIELLKKKKESK